MNILLAALVLLSGGSEPRAWPEDETVIIDNRLEPRFEDAVEFVVEEWDEIAPVDLELVHNPYEPCDWVEGAIVLCPAFEEEKYWGVAVVEPDEGAIEQVIVGIVDAPGLIMWDDQVDAFTVNTICHEIGHALGMPHSPHHKESCVANGSTRTTPGPWDRNYLCFLYGAKFIEECEA